MQQLWIVMYHYTRDLKHSRYPEIKGLDISLFREQIAYLKTNFNVITMEQVLEAVTNSDKLPERALLLTFDDGYIDVTIQSGQGKGRRKRCLKKLPLQRRKH